MMTLEEKRRTRPDIPHTREEFDRWLAWYADPQNGYAWDFDFRFEMNGHTIRASGLFGHICIDNVQHSVNDEYCTVILDGVSYKPTDYIKMKIFG